MLNANMKPSRARVVLIPPPSLAAPSQAPPAESQARAPGRTVSPPRRNTVSANDRTSHHISTRTAGLVAGSMTRNVTPKRRVQVGPASPADEGVASDGVNKIDTASFDPVLELEAHGTDEPGDTTWVSRSPTVESRAVSQVAEHAAGETDALASLSMHHKPLKGAAAFKGIKGITTVNKMQRWKNKSKAKMKQVEQLNSECQQCPSCGHA